MNTKQLRQKILDLAIKGKLVPQDPNDEPASKLLERIREEKEQLIKEGKLKRDKNKSYIFVGDDKLHYEKFADGSVVCIEDEIPFEIPESWAWVRLKDVSIINPKNKADDNTEAGFIPMPLISKNYLESVMFQKKTWNEIKKGFTHFQNNDVVVAKITPCFENSKAAIISNLPNNLGAGTTELHVIRPIKILPEYVYAIAKTKQFLESGKQEMTGCAGQQRVPTSFIEDYLIPIPPINEQQRITQTIKELLNLVETLENDKVNLSELIKKTKAKVLDLAIKGKLVPQDPNDEPADKLLEKIREEKEKLIKEGKLKRDKNETYIFKNSDDNSYYEQIDGETVCINDDLPFEIPQSWRWCKIDNVTTIKGGKRLPSGQSLLNDKTNHPYLRIVDMKNNTIIDDDIHYISEDVFAKIKQYIITDEDLYITIAGTIGNVGIITSKYNNANLTENAVRVTPLLINKKYLMYLILSNYVQNQFIDKTHHVAMPKLAIERIKGVFVPIPPLFEQSNIINKLESIFSYLDNLELIIKGS